MRSALLAIPATLILIAGTDRRVLPISPAPHVAASQAPSDTLRRKGAETRPACPMPVDRPDPGSAAAMPTLQELSPRGRAVIVDSGALASGPEMPVVRSGCWNPLDQPKGDSEPVRIDRQPPR